MSTGSSKPYVIGHDDEHERLERQARVGRIEEHLNRFTFSRDADILDAGCGPGSMTRLLANAAPEGRTVGVDISKHYLDYARQRASTNGINNISFQEGDIFSLPFEDDTFDLVWSKYVLQWVNEPVHAVREFRRVTRSGGKVVCCNFDGFGITHFPIDEQMLDDMKTFFTNAVDPNVGRKMYSMFHQSGLLNIKVQTEQDATFSVSGKIDEDRRQNWIDQFTAASAATEMYFGSAEKARSFEKRFLEFQDREDTFSACDLYFVEGTVP